MPEFSSPQLVHGRAALAAADWAAARTSFEAALAQAHSPEAHDGLGIALWWLNEITASHQHRTAAYAAYKQRGDLGPAVKIAAWLAREQVFFSSTR
jgi:uncharacterized protein HemY